MSAGSQRINKRYTDSTSFPNFSVVDVERRVRKINKVIDRYGFAAKRLVGSTRDRLTEKLERHVYRKVGDMYNGADTSDVTWGLEDLAIDHDYQNRKRAIKHILQRFSEEPVSGRNRKELVNTLAGWYDEIRLGMLFNGWSHTYPIWASLYVSDCVYVPRAAGAKKQVSIKLQSLEGPTAGMEWDLTKSQSYALNLIRNTGVPKFEKHRADDLGGMYITAFVVPKGRSMLFDHFHVSSSQAGRNKKLYKTRQEGCTGAFPPYKGKPCFTCPVSRGVCPNSRISTGFKIKRKCEVVINDNHHEGFFRDYSSPICLGCLLKGNDVRKDKNTE